MGLRILDRILSDIEHGDKSQYRLVQINLLNEDGITYCQRHEKDGTVRQLELKDTSYSAEQTKDAKSE